MREALKLTPTKLYVPFWMWKFAAFSGDIIEKVVRRRMPMNSDVLQKLLGSAFYSAKQLEHELGWKAKQNLLDVLKQMS